MKTCPLPNCDNTNSVVGCLICGKEIPHTPSKSVIDHECEYCLGYELGKGE